MKPKTLTLLAASCTPLCSSLVHADTWTGTTSGSWNVDTNWQDATKPTAAEAVLFNASSTANTATTLDAAFSISGLTIVAPSAAITIANGTGGSLTVGSGGIDMSAATQNLTFSNSFALGASQAWNVASGRNLTLNLASNTAFGLGGFTLTKSGTGTLTATGTNFSNGSILVTEGTFNLNGNSSRNATLQANTSVRIDSGATFATFRNTGTLTLAGAINFNGGLWTLDGGGVATVSGDINVDATNGGTLRYLTTSTGGLVQGFSGAITGSGTLNVQNHGTSHANNRFDFSGNNSGFTGTININGTSGNRNIRLTNANAGSAAAIWNVAANNRLEVNGVTVSLGELTGTGTVSSSTGTSTLQVGGKNTDFSFGGVINNTNTTVVTKVGSGNWTVSGANTYTGGTNVNVGTLTATHATALGTGAVTIGGGNLSTTVNNLGTGALTLNSGSLALNGSSAGSATLGLDVDFTMAGGQWTIDLANGTDQIIGNGTSADFVITGGTIDLGGGSINYGNTYNLLNGFATGSVSGLTFTNYDSSNFTASLNNSGVLAFATVVPEPSIALLGSLGVLGLLRRRR